MSKGFLGSLAAIFGLAALLAFVFPSHGDAALDQWVASVGQELHGHQSFVLREQQAGRAVVRYKTVAAWLQDSVNALKTAYSALRGRGDSLALVGDSAGALVVFKTAGAICSEALSACQQRGDSLAKAVQVSETARFLAVARADSADSLLRSGAGLKGCRFLVFPCPTRREAFGLGAGAATIILLLARAVKL